MILMPRGTANDFYVTLAEKMTLTASDYFLFVFRYGGNVVTKVMQATDSSTYGQWYKFTMTNSAAQVNLNVDGDWRYDVYEQTSSTNTNPDAATSKVESGTCRVTGNQSWTYVGSDNEPVFVTSGND